ncbi:TetR/AcrR family transcriptional regulator [Subtercola boreus]|uniref:TetR family transcriptional regulator n=1 Tax=Subtercola boreus TaxID=120213 RepID=A0A3E0WAA7_9MICO|nr:TetR/AcrR family transcriptional regulator [Subtercola boreus]RFA20853.1 TetR family transcriptional regulator [Subtercola boreus]RFA20970.1 TetR family transcriptional regulator [Subtercola boreus]RFA27164.1 TetR family transcriptional regulator [Subtercola boreus]
MTTAPPSRAGRPRANADAPDGTLTAREQILDAAAALFAESGFSGASTRAIADRVGIRQQSLYYHFAGKDDILAELLSGSVRPSIEFVDGIEALVPERISPAGALFALASTDARTLRRTPHNIGTLYLLPEIQDARYDDFRNERVRLQASYGRLGAAAAHPDVIATLSEHRIGSLLIQLVELVIQLRRDTTDAAAEDDDATIASSCLRVLGLSTPEIASARIEANGFVVPHE